MKPASPAQIAARKRFAEMARSGAFKKATKRKANPGTSNASLANWLDRIASGETYSETKLKEALQHPGVTTEDKIVIRAALKGAPYSHTDLQQAAINIRQHGKRQANPRESTIKVGDYVRSYDFPGMHEDHYLEGEVIEVKPYSYIIHVMNRIVGGEKKTVPTALKQVEAPKGPHFITKVHGVQKVMKNPAKKTVSQKISQLVHEGYPQRQAVAVALSEQRAGKVKRNPMGEIQAYAITRNFKVLGIFQTKQDAIKAAQGISDATGKTLAIKPVQVMAGHFNK